MTDPVEKVSQEQMLAQFKERLQNLVNENQEAAKKIKDNEVVALKLQGAIEALEYYQDNPPTPDIPADNVESESTEIDNLTT